MSMLRRCAGRLLARPGRYHTGLADVPAIDNAREVLTSLYKRQIEVCMSYQGEKVFNSSVIGQARHHLSILEKFPNDWDVEYEINMGPLEKLITYAEDQLELVDVMNNEFRPAHNFNKESALAAARQSSDPFFGQDDPKRTLVFHPVPAGVPSAAELGPFPSIPYVGWPYVPPPKGWKYGDGHSRDNWETAATKWVEALNTPRQKLVAKFMTDNNAEDRAVIAASVAEAASLALADNTYSADKKPAGHDAAVQYAKDQALARQHDQAIYLNGLYDRAAKLIKEGDEFTIGVANNERQRIEPVMTEDELALLQSEIGRAAKALNDELIVPPPAQPIKF